MLYLFEYIILMYVICV